MSRDFFLLNVPDDELYMGDNFSKMRMEMYRSRGGFSVTKKGNLEIRHFAEDHFKKYMAMLDKDLHLNEHLSDPKFANAGLRTPEDLIYIDGKPAFEFALGLGYSEKELKEYPQIVRAEIASAMTGGRNHVDIVVPSINEYGSYELKAHELRADVSDLNGRESWGSSSRAKRMESLYQSKNRNSRLNGINKAMSAKAKKINDVKFLSEQILYNAGLEEENIHNPNVFKHEKEYAFNQALEILKEAEHGNYSRKMEVNEEYARKVADGFRNKEYHADIVAGEKLGNEKRDDYINNWRRIGEQNAEINCITRVDSRVTNAVAFAICKNPTLKTNHLMQDKEQLSQAIMDYYKYLEANPTAPKEIDKEVRNNRYKQQAKFFRGFRKIQMNEFPAFDYSNKEERMKRMEQMNLLRDMVINCFQNEALMLDQDKYVEAYGGKEKLDMDRDICFLLSPMITSLSIVDDPNISLDKRVAALHFINKYGAFYQKITKENMHEVAKLGIAEALGNAQNAHEESFDDVSEKDLKSYLYGGPLPRKEKELDQIEKEVAIEKSGKPLRSVKELLAAVDKINQKLAKDKKEVNNQKIDMAELIDKQNGNAPERKRAKAVHINAPKNNPKLEKDPLKKK